MLHISTIETLGESPDYWLEISQIGTSRVIVGYASGYEFKFKDITRQSDFDFKTTDREKAARFIAEVVSGNEVFSISQKEAEKILNS